MRKHLPDERKSVTREFVISSAQHGRISCFLTLGFYDDGSVGELSVKIDGACAVVGVIVDQWAAMVSLALQLGVPVESVISKFRGVYFEPRGWVSSSAGDIRSCASPIDLAMQWIELYEERAS